MYLSLTTGGIWYDSLSIVAVFYTDAIKKDNYYYLKIFVIKIITVQRCTQAQG